MEKMKQDAGLGTLQDIVRMTIDKIQRKLFPLRRALNE